MIETQKIPEEILISPSLLYLYFRIERLIGINANHDALISLNEKIEKKIKSTFIENPASYENILSSQESIYKLSKIFTVNETYFFREEAQFKLLADLLPELHSTEHPLRICSAASSTGCEAYSIAMLLDHYKNSFDSTFDFTIDAFDINSESVEKAKQAVYSANALRSDGLSFNNILEKYLHHEKSELLVTQSIRKKVNFFTHNIMNSLDKHYDLIFFRNALIYFSPEGRLQVLNNLADALNKDGILFTGTSETSSVKHPLLTSLNKNDVFYFKKTQSADSPVLILQKTPVFPPLKTLEKADTVAAEPATTKLKKAAFEKPGSLKSAELTVECDKVAQGLEMFETKGTLFAKKYVRMIEDGNASSITGSELASCVLNLLDLQDFGSADTALSYLEKCNSCAFTKFLRGEYIFLQDKEGSEEFYQEAAIKNKNFWPALYRIASLAYEGDRVSYEQKIKKAIESIENGKDEGYECFLGGFSPDYFLRILEKKIVN